MGYFMHLIKSDLRDVERKERSEVMVKGETRSLCLLLNHLATEAF